ncbi:hypothetical protein Tco_0408098 [Tanacetum coccineum]
MTHSLCHLFVSNDNCFFTLMKAEKDRNIYLGPHESPPSQAKQEYIDPSWWKQRFKQKLKDADQRKSGSRRENKMENLRDLMGGSKTSVNTSKSSSRDVMSLNLRAESFILRLRSCKAENDPNMFFKLFNSTSRLLYTRLEFGMYYLEVGIEGLKTLKPQQQKGIVPQNGHKQIVKSHGGVDFEADKVLNEDDDVDGMVEAVVTKDELQHVAQLCKSEVDIWGE